MPATGSFPARMSPWVRLRARASFESVFRKVQDASMHRLHMLEAGGQIKGFVLSYRDSLIQRSHAPARPRQTRGEAFGYPTDFAAMTDDSIEKLSKRGGSNSRVCCSITTRPGFEFLPFAKRPPPLQISPGQPRQNTKRFRFAFVTSFSRLFLLRKARIERLIADRRRSPFEGHK